MMTSETSPSDPPAGAGAGFACAILGAPPGGEPVPYLNGCAGEPAHWDIGITRRLYFVIASRLPARVHSRCIR